MILYVFDWLKIDSLHYYNTNFDQIALNIKAQQEQQLQILQEQWQNNNDILQKLKSAANNAPKNNQSQPKSAEIIIQSGSKTTTEDGFEIIETNGNTSPQNNQAQTFTVQTSHKLRPNDKVTVRHADGKVEFDVKYKKVVDAIKEGKAEII